MSRQLGGMFHWGVTFIPKSLRQKIQWILRSQVLRVCHDVIGSACQRPKKCFKGDGETVNPRRRGTTYKAVLISTYRESTVNLKSLMFYTTKYLEHLFQVRYIIAYKAVRSSTPHSLMSNALLLFPMYSLLYVHTPPSELSSEKGVGEQIGRRVAVL